MDRSILRTMYPEMDAGGFARSDGSVAFYTRVHALLTADDVVLDFGAGRGRFNDTAPAYSRALQDLRPHVSRVIGVDPDPAVHQNATVHEARVMPDVSTVPVDSLSVDVVVTNWVFEHVTDPAAVAAELDRVLKPGGLICARTPNRWGHWAVGARLVSNRAHDRLLSWMGTRREGRDIFPTRYLMNTPRALRALFPGYRVIVYGHVPPPDAGRSLLANQALRRLLKLAPEAASTIWFIFLQKAEGA